MADIDLLIEQPTLGETASVQVKSRASQGTLNAHIAYFEASGLPRTFFVCHSPDGQLSIKDATGVHLWTGESCRHRGQIRIVRVADGPGRLIAARARRP